MARSTVSAYLRGVAAVVPTRQVPIGEVLEVERERVERQLGGLGAGLRARVEAGLGIEAVPVHDGLPSALALAAVERALAASHLPPAAVDVVIDFSTLPGDFPGIWSLAHRVQAELPGARADALGVHGAGCAGFHLALRTALAWLADGAETIVLVSADRNQDGGRASLPVSVMSDAGSALVLSRTAPDAGPRLRLRAVVAASVGAFHDIIRAEGHPPKIEVDAARFEQQVLPVHFVFCHRVLHQALADCDRTLEDLTSLVYPNTSELDRRSVVRALGIDPARLAGPGPRAHGHAFAADMVINLPPLASLRGPSIAWLAVGSGFTWGAAIADVEPAP